MLLKVIFIGLVFAFFYRLLGGKIPFIDKKEESTKEEEHEFGQIEATSECVVCSTYVTENDALIYQKKSYCSSECLNKAKA